MRGKFRGKNFRLATPRPYAPRQSLSRPGTSFRGVCVPNRAETSTDGNGSYLLRGLPSGRHAIRVTRRTAAGALKPASISVLLRPSGATTTWDSGRNCPTTSLNSSPGSTAGGNEKVTVLQEVSWSQNWVVTRLEGRARIIRHPIAATPPPGGAPSLIDSASGSAGTACHYLNGAPSH